MDKIDIYDVSIKWKAVFSTKNVSLESKTNFGAIAAEPKEGGTDFLVEFSTETPDQRVAKGTAFRLFDGLKTILELMIGKPCLVELSALEMVNAKDIAGHSSYKLITGEDYYKEMLSKSVKLSRDSTEKMRKAYEYLYPQALGFVSVGNYDLQYSLLTMLHWYRKAIEETSRYAQLIALWISFNAAYSFVWRRDHKEPRRAGEMTMMKHLIVASNLLMSKESGEIIERHRYLWKVLPDPGEEEDLIRQFGKDWREYCNNPYGFDFWEHQKAKRWAEALSEIVAFIYGVRNGLFHGRWLPEDSELISESVFTLHDVVKPVLERLVESGICEEVGRITHFYSKASVAVIKLSAPLNKDDKVIIRGGRTNTEQNVDSMEIEHKQILTAQTGQLVGMKVNERVREKDIVYRLKH